MQSNPPPAKLRIFERPTKDGQTLTVTIGTRFKGVEVAQGDSIRDLVTQLRSLADWAERQIL